jgi:uncharacterized membrane protein YphA (DoxX/SURF4 family)
MDGTRTTEGAMSTPERVSLRETSIALMRVILGCVFIFASIDKIADPHAFAASITNYKIVSGNLTLLLATVLPWIELLSGLGLLFGVFIRGSALLTLCMLFLFTILVGSAMLRGLDISCGCFTQDPSAERIGWKKIGENLLLLAMNVVVFYPAVHRFSLEGHLRKRETTKP